MASFFVGLNRLPLFFIVCSLVPGQTRGQSSTDSPELTEEQRVLAVEDAWVQAEVQKDEAVLRRVIDDRFVFNRSSGQLSGKEKLISGILEGRMTGQTITERSVLVDGDVAVVCGTAELRFARESGEESLQLLRYTTTYIKRQEQWRALALQMQPRLQR